MRTTTVGSIIMIAMLLLGSCAVPPRWTQQEPRAFFCEQEAAFFGVGVGEADLGEVRWTVARMDARRNLALAKMQYVHDLLQELAASHSDWFTTDGLADESAGIAERVRELTFFPIEVARSREDTRYLPWEDTSGRHEGASTAYILARQPHDNDFVQGVRQAVSEVLEERGDALLTTDPETVLNQLTAMMTRHGDAAGR